MRVPMYQLFTQQNLFLLKAETPDKGIHVVAFSWIEVGPWYENGKLLLRSIRVALPAALAGEAQGIGPLLGSCNVLGFMHSTRP